MSVVRGIEQVDETQPLADAEIVAAYRIARRVAVIAGLFTLMISAMLLANTYKINSYNPNDAPSVIALKAELALEPTSDERKQAIRDQDMVLRTTFFQRRQMGRRGAWLIILGVVVTVIAGKRAMGLRPQFQTPMDPHGFTEEEQVQFGNQSRMAMIGLGGLVVVGGLFLGISSPNIPLIVPKAVEVVEKVLPPATPEEYAANWPAFRGPTGSGVVAEGLGFEGWDGAAGQNILWKTPIAMAGPNSPVVWGDRVFLSGGKGAKCQVFCLDAKSGRIVWQRELKGIEGDPGEDFTTFEEVGPAVPTLATDGRRVYALFANGLLAAFDFEGERVWAEGLGAPDNAYGHATSLITYGETVLVQWDQGYDDDDLSKLIAINGVTGEHLWEKPRAVYATWASPVIINTGGRDQLLTFAEPFAIAYDPTNGDELWRFEGPAGDVAPSPIVSGDTMFMAVPWDRLVAVKMDGSGDVTETHELWESTSGVPDITTPVTDGARVYMIETEGLMTVVSVETGEMVWEHSFDTTIQASPTIIGDKLYVTSLEGVTFVLQVGDKFEQVGEYALGEGVVACMAVLDGRVYLRGEKHLYCIGEDSK